MKKELAIIDPKEFGLEESNVVTIEQAFSPKVVERDALIEVYSNLITKELTPELCKEAKELRLKFVKIRTGISEIHKTQKAFFLSAGRFVDAWKNKETIIGEQAEEKLSEIENYFVNIEKERIAKLQAERLEECKKYTEYPISELGTMSDEGYEPYLTGLKVAYQSRLEAEAKAESERLAAIEAERIEQLRIKEENLRLQAENEAKEKQLQAERAEAIKKQNEFEEAAREKQAKEKAESDRLIAIEREKQAKLEAELKAKKDAEISAQKEAEKIEKERIESEIKAAKAPLKTKLTIWVDSFSIDEFESNTTADDIKLKFESFKKWAKSEIEKI